MKELLKRLKAAFKTPIPYVWKNLPNTVEIHDGFMVIKGEFPANQITVGMQESHDFAKREFHEHECILGCWDGEMEPFGKITPDNLSYALRRLNQIDKEDHIARAWSREG